MWMRMLSPWPASRKSTRRGDVEARGGECERDHLRSVRVLNVDSQRFCDEPQRDHRLAIRDDGHYRRVCESIARVMPFSDACGLSIQRSSESFASMTVTFRVENSQATVPPKASMMARIGTRVLPATMTGLVPWASMGCCTPLTDMDALPIHSLIVVDDKAVAPDGTRSPTTRRMAARALSKCVLFMSPSFIRNNTP